MAAILTPAPPRAPVGMRPLADLLPKPADTGPLPPGVAHGGWTSDQGYIAAHNWPGSTGAPPLTKEDN